MVFWVAIAVLTAAATVALLAPLFRARVGAAEKAAAMAIYRDQLDEIDRDIARGILAPAEAKGARTEIARRLLQTEERPAEVMAETRGDRRAAIIGAVIAVPLISLGLYIYFGEPDTPDLPIAARLEDPAEDDFVARAAVLADAVVATPDDIGLWREALDVNFMLGNVPAVVEAYGEVVRLGGADADPEGRMAIGLSQVLVQAGEPVAALEVLVAARDAAPDNPQPRLFLAALIDQAGLVDQAIAEYEAALALAPEGGAPWVEQTEARLAQLRGQVPDPAAAIADLAPADQQAAIAGMVEGLAARLASDGGSPQDWAQLIRSYIVLDRREDAAAAVESARTAFAGDDAALAVVNEAAQMLEQQP